MEIGVGPARYRDLNSDLPVCITQDFLLIQTVTGLPAGIWITSFTVLGGISILFVIVTGRAIRCQCFLVLWHHSDFEHTTTGGFNIAWKFSKISYIIVQCFSNKRCRMKKRERYNTIWVCVQKENQRATFQQRLQYINLLCQFLFRTARAKRT